MLWLYKDLDTNFEVKSLDMFFWDNWNKFFNITKLMQDILFMYIEMPKV